MAPRYKKHGGDVHGIERLFSIFLTEALANAHSPFAVKLSGFDNGGPVALLQGDGILARPKAGSMSFSEANPYQARAEDVSGMVIGEWQEIPVDPDDERVVENAAQQVLESYARQS